MAKKKPQRQSSVPKSDVSTILGHTPGRTYEERKRGYDKQRTRLRLDVPDWLKAGLESDAGELQVSVSQLGAFLLAYALRLYRDGDPELRALLEQSKHRIASLRWAFGIDLADLAEPTEETDDGDVLDF